MHGLLARGIAGGAEDRPGIIHRLDRDTSGLLVVTRSAEAYEVMQGLVRRRELEREYVALVQGHPRSRSGRIEAPIGRDRHDPTRHSLDTATPREAVTLFEVERLVGERALLRVRLETGGRTRSGCTSRRSACRSRVTPCTGSAATSGSSGSFSMPRGSPSHIR